MNPEQLRKKEQATMTVGAILCGILAGLMTTAIFLWIYSFDTYRVAFSGRFIGNLSSHLKYLFLLLSASAWSIVFAKWVFKRKQLRN